MRAFVPKVLQPGSQCDIDGEAFHHLARVLRVKPGQRLTVFNGDGGEYGARVTQVGRAHVVVAVENHNPIERESPVSIHLAQAVGRGERMDYAVQKAVELGVQRIIPLVTERCVVKLDHERAQRRNKHWRGIIAHACEQSGRNRLARLDPALSLSEWLQGGVETELRWVLATDGEALGETLVKQPAPVKSLTVLIGPEGGLSDDEMARVKATDFRTLKLGPRILRTETAAVVALTTMQMIFGDLRLASPPLQSPSKLS